MHMRLSQCEREAIVDQAREIFGSQTKVYLFGSRTDDSRRGGDIDLYIVPVNKDNLWRKEVRLHTQLQLILGEQKIDIVVAIDSNRPIEQVAQLEGIEL